MDDTGREQFVAGFDVRPWPHATLRPADRVVNPPTPKKTASIERTTRGQPIDSEPEVPVLLVSVIIRAETSRT
jgi:hypothetical protein